MSDLLNQWFRRDPPPSGGEADGPEMQLMCPRLARVTLQSLGRVIRRMLGQPPPPGPLADRPPLLVIPLLQIPQRLLRRRGDEDLLAGDEEAVQPVPPI